MPRARFIGGAGLLLRAAGGSAAASPQGVRRLPGHRRWEFAVVLSQHVGRCYTQSGRFDDAHEALDEGLAVAEKNDDRCHEAELHRLKGELLLAESHDQTAAEECFRTAIETARRQQSKAWELRATMSLARLWQRQGRRDEARAALAAVYGTYTEGFTTPDLVDAKALLESLAHMQA